MRPGKKHSEEEAQGQVKADSFGLDDLVTINGITGYVDFIGGDIIVLIDKNDKSYEFAIKDIRSIVKRTTFIEGNLTNVAIKYILCKAGHF